MESRHCVRAVSVTSSYPHPVGRSPIAALLAPDEMPQTIDLSVVEP